MPYSNYSDAARKIANLRPFRGGSWHGQDGPSNDTGRLPREWVEQFRQDQNKIIYAVYSYATPIAWVTEDGTATIPDVSYSRTTTRQQNAARVALN